MILTSENLSSLLKYILVISSVMGMYAVSGWFFKCVLR